MSDSSPTAPRVAGPRIAPRQLALGGLVALAAAMGIGRFIYTPILPPMAEGLALSKGEAGLIASANFLGYLLGALLAAASRLPGSARAWLLGGLAGSALTTGAMGWSDGMALYLLLRLLGGVASAFVLVFSSFLILERLSAAGRGGLSALHFAGVGVGIALSALLTWALEAGGAGWREMWLGGGALSLLAVAVVAALVPARRDEAESAGSGGAPQGGPRLWPLITAYGLFGFGYVITATFIVAIVRATPKLEPVEPLVWLAVGLAGAPSVAAWSLLARRLGEIPSFAIACLVEAVGVLASVLWLEVAGIFIAAAFLGGTFMAITALGLVAARQLSRGHPRRALGLMTAAFGLGQIIGPLVAGYGFDLTGSFTAPSLMAALALCIAAFLAARVQRRSL